MVGRFALMGVNDIKQQGFLYEVSHTRDLLWSVGQRQARPLPRVRETLVWEAARSSGTGPELYVDPWVRPDS